MFLSDLKLRSIRGSDCFVLDGVLIFCYTHKSIARELRVPIGTLTDFASIPKFLRGFIDDNEGAIKDAAVVHDYLYSVQSSKTYPEIDRAGADFVLFEAMKDLNAPLWKRRTVYWAVRLFGWLFYKTDGKPEEVKWPR